jgi:diacylglycerol kinase (ATP)
MRACIIANPLSGGGHHRHALEQAADILRSQGWQVALRFTDAPGAARRLAQEAVLAQDDIVIAAGGDGTVNETIQALASTRTALGVLPLGTVNVWAREIGLPLGAREAALALLNGQRRRIDLGVANGRYFLLMAGVGFDAEVARAIERHPLKRWGLLAYSLVTLQLSINYRGTRVRLLLDGRQRRTRVLMVIVGNTQLYAGAFHFTAQALCDDGLLDVCIVRGQDYFSRLRVLFNALRRRPRLGSRVIYERCKELRIDGGQRLPIQVDGEPTGAIPLECHIAPAALHVIVPTTAPTRLFSLPPETPTPPFP